MKAGSHILIVEDNASFRELIREVFGYLGYRVSEASNGQEGLALMEQASINLAIVDLEMPQMNGLEFTKRVKERNPKFPVIMVTAYAALHSPAEIVNANVDAFLQKPVGVDTLIDIVEKL
jgi:two-component system, NtrC family, nitrogen regulation response regulator NtrX